MDYELAYRYGVPSCLDEYAGLALSTSGGSTPEGEAACPYFFSGFMERPEVVAAGLRATRATASTCRPAWSLLQAVDSPASGCSTRS